MDAGALVLPSNSDGWREAALAEGQRVAQTWITTGGGHETATMHGWVFISGPEGLPSVYPPGVRVLQMRNEIDPHVARDLRILLALHEPIDEEDTVVVVQHAL